MSKRFDELGKLIKQLMADHATPGVVVGVLNRGKSEVRGYGVTNVNHPLKVTPDTLFQVGSISKTYTATLMMHLVEQGKLDLHADVNQYLDFTIPATYPEPITIAHLLTHTSGFEEQLAALLVAEAADVQPLGDFLRTWLPTRIYPPGTTFAYSNYATALAGYIVERVSGEVYEDYIVST